MISKKLKKFLFGFSLGAFLYSSIFHAYLTAIILTDGYILIWTPEISESFFIVNNSFIIFHMIITTLCLIVTIYNLMRWTYD